MSISPEEKPKKTKQQLIAESFAHLVGVGISISEAADKYGVPRSAVADWLYRTNDVSFLDRDAYPRLVNEAEVALCVQIYKARRKEGIAGIPYFNPDGTEYTIKNPERSRRRKAA